MNNPAAKRTGYQSQKKTDLNHAAAAGNLPKEIKSRRDEIFVATKENITLSPVRDDI